MLKKAKEESIFISQLCSKGKELKEFDSSLMIRNSNLTIIYIERDEFERRNIIGHGFSGFDEFSSLFERRFVKS